MPPKPPSSPPASSSTQPPSSWDDAARWARYRALIAKVDAHTAKVEAAHSAHLRCRRGCTACCRQDLHVSPVEADHITAWLLAQGALPARSDQRGPHDDHPLFETLARGEACVFLGADGGCGVYPVRPLICRTHGLPVVLDGVVDACPLNYADLDDLDAAIPDGARLQLDTVNTLLALVQQLYAQEDAPGASETPPDASERVPLSEVRARAEALLEAYSARE